MSKSSAGKVILRTFLKTLIILFVFIGVGVLSYFLTTLYYNLSSRTEKSTTYEHVIDTATGVDSTNIIYSVDEDTKVIHAIVIEFYNNDTHNMDYLTIPAATAIETSNELFQEMFKVSNEVPQIVRLSMMRTYFGNDVAYEYGIKVLEEALSIDIGYFTAMPSDTFNKYFENKGDANAPTYGPNATLLTEAGTTSDSIDDFMDKIWDDISLDITFDKKATYAEGLAQVNKDMIHCYRAPATRLKKTYTLNVDETNKLITQIVDNEQSYTTAQSGSADSSTETTTESSKGKKIYITNASQINGLAAAYQKKLEEAGFTVIGVGTSTGEVQTDTKILVKKKKFGKDLVTYFKSATVEKSATLSSTEADIEIVLGTNDRLTGY